MDKNTLISDVIGLFRSDVDEWKQRTERLPKYSYELRRELDELRKRMPRKHPATSEPPAYTPVIVCCTDAQGHRVFCVAQYSPGVNMHAEFEEAPSYPEFASMLESIEKAGWLGLPAGFTVQSWTHIPDCLLQE